MAAATLGVGSSNKVFVGGLPQSCPEEVLSNYFMQYGTIIDSVVMKDRETGNSRGFGFVTFEDTSSVDMIMAQYDDHKINRKWVEVKRAVPQADMPAGSETKGKGKGRSKGNDRSSRDDDDRRRDEVAVRSDEAPRSSDTDRAGGDVRPGDWQCPKCNSNVFASKSSCFKCGTQKNEVPAPAAMGHPGYPAGYPGMVPGMPPAHPGMMPGYPGYPMHYGYPGYPMHGAYPGYPPSGGYPPPSGYPSGYPYDQYPQGCGYPQGYGYAPIKGDGKGDPVPAGSAPY